MMIGDRFFCGESSLNSICTVTDCELDQEVQTMQTGHASLYRDIHCDIKCAVLINAKFFSFFIRRISTG